jgi:hypothetical protein
MSNLHAIGGASDLSLINADLILLSKRNQRGKWDRQRLQRLMRKMLTNVSVLRMQSSITRIRG